MTTLVHHGRSLRPGINESQVLWLAALLSVGAGAIHFAVAPAHFAEYALFGWAFVAVAWLQMLWALGITSRRSRPLLVAGIAGNLLLVAIWLWTRVVSVPLGPGAGEAEAFGWLDGVVVGMELAIVFLILVDLFGERHLGRPGPVLALIVVGSVALTAIVGFALADDNPSAHDESSSSAGAGHTEH